MKTLIIVIDSFGIGEMPDANDFGDVGSNTLKNIYNTVGVNLPNMASLGLYNVEGVNLPYEGKVVGNYARLEEKTHAKDTTAGHYEMMGIVLEKPYPTFPEGFPADFVKLLEEKCGIEFLGNCVASGTEIINRLGKQSIEEKKAILYTSADSVLQVACHDSVLPLEELYRVCATCRELSTGDYNVGRIIDRPFTTEADGTFKRTEDRKDYALCPPTKSALDFFKEAGYDVVGVGKIEDIFQWQGITESYHTKNNEQGLEKSIELSKSDKNGIIFINLVDTDMLFGHRNDAQGYATALEYIDSKLPEIMENLNEEDILIVTADHGCDPTTVSTDHSREYVPMLVYSKSFKQGVDLKTLKGFDTISNNLLCYYGVNEGNSIFDELKK